MENFVMVYNSHPQKSTENSEKSVVKKMEDYSNLDHLKILYKLVVVHHLLNLKISKSLKKCLQ